MSISEDKASKFCRTMRDHSSFKVGLTGTNTTWSSSFISGLMTRLLEKKSKDTQEKLPALVQAINSAKNASTSDISVNSWASKRRNQQTTN